LGDVYKILQNGANPMSAPACQISPLSM